MYVGRESEKYCILGENIGLNVLKLATGLEILTKPAVEVEEITGPKIEPVTDIEPVTMVVEAPVVDTGIPAPLFVILPETIILPVDVWDIAEPPTDGPSISPIKMISPAVVFDMIVPVLTVRPIKLPEIYILPVPELLLIVTAPKSACITLPVTVNVSELLKEIAFPAAMSVILKNDTGPLMFTDPRGDTLIPFWPVTPPAPGPHSTLPEIFTTAPEPLTVIPTEPTNPVFPDTLPVIVIWALSHTRRVKPALLLGHGPMPIGLIFPIIVAVLEPDIKSTEPDAGGAFGVIPVGEVAVNVIPFASKNVPPPNIAEPDAEFVILKTVTLVSITTVFKFAYTSSDAVGIIEPDHIAVSLQFPFAMGHLFGIFYKFPFEAIAAPSVATVATLRKRAPKLPVTVKLFVFILHTFCVSNEAEPVVLSTGTPLSTEPVGGIATVPVNWFVSPNTIPCLTFEADGKLPGQFCVYNVLCSAYVSVSKVHVVVEPESSCMF